MRKQIMSSPVLILALVALLGRHEAKAAEPGEPCTKIGRTALSEDMHVTLACLYSKSDTMVWTDLIPHASQESASLSGSKSPAIIDPEDHSSSRTTRWEGWYGGGNVGLADTTSDVIAPNFSTTQNIHRYGAAVGVVGGYNFVRSDGLFYGAEADVNYMNNTSGYNDSSSSVTKSAWNGYATARGRLGTAFNSALLFLTGGLVVADINYQYRGITTPTSDLSKNGIQIGWTAGAGAEFALTNSISLNLQYLRLEMPETSRTGRNSVGDPVKFLFDNSANILRVGANWHFD